MRNSDKIILDLCGGTGSWSRPYRREGYDVRLVTLPDNDVRTFVLPNEPIYGILAAPPCQMFSFARTNAKKPRDLESAMLIVYHCLRIIWEAQYKTESDVSKKTRLKFWALENPNGMLKYFLGSPAMIFSPFEFGDDYKKKTHLWGWFNEPKRNPIKCSKPKFDKLLTKEIHPEFYGKLTRTERRAITPRGFSEAFYQANK